MNGRCFALTIWSVGVVIAVGHLALLALALGTVGQTDTGTTWLRPFISTVGLSLGALIAVRRPRNPIGWILIADAFLGLVSGTAGAYARYAVALPSGVLPFADWMGLLSSVWGRAGTALPFFAILLFPTGGLPSARWRLVPWLGVISVFGFLLRAFSPEVTAAYGIANPIGILWWPRWFLDGGFGGLALFGFVIAALAALIVRFRRASGVERQQLSGFWRAEQHWSFRSLPMSCSSSSVSTERSRSSASPTRSRRSL